MIGLSGGSGFIGKNLLKKLSKNKLVLLQNNSDLNVEGKKNFTKINKKNIHDIKIIKKLTNKVNIFINLSSKYEDNTKDDLFFIENNIVDQIKIFNFCQKINVKYFINIHTSLDPKINRYSFTKDVFAQWINRFNKKIIIVNLTTDFIFGYQDNRFTDHLLKKLLFTDDFIYLTKCNQKRNFIHINDLCSHIHYLIKNINKIKTNRNLFITSKETIPLKSFILKIIESLNKKGFEGVIDRVKFGHHAIRKYESINKIYKKSEFFKKVYSDCKKLDTTIPDMVEEYLN